MGGALQGGDGQHSGVTVPNTCNFPANTAAALPKVETPNAKLR